MMDTEHRPETSSGRIAWRSCLGALVGAALLAGCASSGNVPSSPLGSGVGVTATDSARLTRSGFLTDYARLKPIDGGGVECWRDPGLDARKYDKVMVSRIVVSLKPRGGVEPTVDPSDLKTLTDYFHASLVNALKPHATIVDAPQPGTVVIRIALTSLVPTGVVESLAGTLTPYGFVAEAGSGVATGRPAGSTPYLGETGIEVQFRDGGSGAVLGECRDTEIGRKYAANLDSGATGAAQTWANGYLNSFQSWAYAKDAFDKWSMLIAQRFAQLRAAKQG
jgi:hypothetical protein